MGRRVLSLMTRGFFAALVLFLLLAAGCAATREFEIERPEGALAAPTLSSIFGQSASGAGLSTRAVGGSVGTTPVGWFEPAEATPTAAPTPTPENTVPPPPSPTPPRLITETMYADGLADAWTLDNSRWMSYTEQSDVVRSGDLALRFQAQEDFSSFFFTVRRGARQTFLSRQVMGVGMWLNPGDTELGLEDLVLTVLGSNELTYWSPDDDSVTNDTEPVFSETRLYFLGFNQPFPPNEWTYVEVWLDDLLFDPEYEFVTGFYIKNDRGVFQPLYLDDVHLIMLEEPAR